MSIMINIHDINVFEYFYIIILFTGKACFSCFKEINDMLNKENVK